jgi:hypothetical protein
MPKSSNENAEKLLEAIRNKDRINFDAFVDLYSFFVVNSENLSELNILAGVKEIEIDEDGVREKEMAMQEKRINLMTKFSEKYDYYLKTLNSLRADLSKQDLKKAEAAVDFKTKTGVSVEERMKRRKG